MIWARNTVPAAAAVLVLRCEGFRSHCYLDGGGTWTIGCGSTRDAQGNPVIATTPPVTRDQALTLCQRDLAGAAQDLTRLLARTTIDEGQAAALVSFVQNLGATKVSKSTLLSRLNSGQTDTVPEEFAKWNRIKGTPSLGLARRRWAEAAVFLGADPDHACDLAWARIANVNQWPDLELALPTQEPTS